MCHKFWKLTSWIILPLLPLPLRVEDDCRVYGKGSRSRNPLVIFRTEGPSYGSTRLTCLPGLCRVLS